MIVKSRRFTIASFLLAALAPSAHADPPPGHVSTATHFVDNVDPADNSYGDPASLYEIAHDLGAHEVHNRTKCGSFLAQLFKNSYLSITDAVLTGLTTSTSPYAGDWWDGIDLQREYPVNAPTHKLTRRASIWEWQVGDLLVAKYTNNGDTGHAMLIVDIREAAPGESDEQFYDTPSVPGAARWMITVIDSSTSPHHYYAGDDTRKDAVSPGVNDTGIGEGQIVVWADASSGAPVGWMWSRWNGGDFFQQSANVTCAKTNNAKTCQVRPLIAGQLTIL
jgi:hypothetical protein